MPAPTANSLIDRVDDSDRVAGTVRRGEVFARHANFRTVHVFVFNRRGELLLQRLGPARERHPLRWGSSVAAYLHAGESYREAAQRRLTEELGLRTPVTWLGRTAMDDAGCRKFVGLFATEADEPRIVEQDHIEDVKFVSVADIARLLVQRPSEFTETFKRVFAYWTTAQHSPT